MTWGMASSPGVVPKTIMMLSPFLIRLGFLDMGFFSHREESSLHGESGASWGLGNIFPATCLFIPLPEI